MSGFEELLERRKKGSLKIYLGYAAGVGKTFAMLQEGHRLKARGFDVVIGYLEPHDRPETWAQIKDLEMVPRRQLTIGGRTFEEMDVDAILNRKPQIVLIDEAAHTNEPGSKNEKRYQDILEILGQQINVITTLNVQHLESVADKVAFLTKVEIRERVPDTILTFADQLVNVDVSIDELRERLRMGKIYHRTQADLALSHFFTPSNLSMLRETVLREAAGDQIRRIEEQTLLTGGDATLAHDTVMVALSSDPNNAEILIRKAAKIASQLSSKCVVVYVQRKFERPTVIDSALQRKLQNNLKLAQTLGAEVVTLQGEKISEVLVNFAHENNVRHAVFGKSRLSPLRERLRGSVLLDFIHDSVGIDVHIVTTTNW
jgi:two-component system, OmpR family, sensor histidine kinase KdpD